MKDVAANDVDEYWDLLGLLLFSTFRAFFLLLGIPTTGKTALNMYLSG
jgi:hypothetical protein